MTLFNIILIIGFLSITLPLFFIACSQRKWWGVIILFSLITKATLAFVVEAEAKYFFTLDNYSYEQRAWTLSQLGSATDLSSLEDGPVAAPFSFYERYLALIFSLAGYKPFLAVLINVILSTAAMGITALIAEELFPKTKASWASMLILCIYPSLLIWSSVNIRDPLFLLAGLSCILLLIRISRDWRRTLTHLPLLFISFYILTSLRPYFGKIFIPAIVGGYILQILYIHVIKKIPKWCTAIIAFLCMFLIIKSLTHYFPTEVSTFLEDLGDTRKAFSNIGTDDFAQSSFAMNYTFDNLWKFVLFIPYSLIYFFFAPFPWTITTKLQIFSLPEVLAVYILTLPTLRGIIISWKNQPRLTIFLIFLVFIVSAAYSVTVSNVGTLFRHRTFSFYDSFYFYGVRN